MEENGTISTEFINQLELLDHYYLTQSTIMLKLDMCKRI